MRKASVLLALLSACSGGKPWVSQVREPVVPPPPPERVMRLVPDFSVRDDASRKTFFLYAYSETAPPETVIVVVPYDPPGGTRLATREERDLAMRLFSAEWKARGDVQRLRYFNDLHDREVRRSATQLDEQIHFARAARRQLEEELATLWADYKSRKDTNTFEEGSEKLSLVSSKTLEQEIVRRDRALAIATSQLQILEYKRSLQDARPAAR